MAIVTAAVKEAVVAMAVRVATAVNEVTVVNHW